MIDGSHDSFEGNILLTRSVVEMAKPNGIPVEAELGKVGGKEAVSYTHLSKEKPRLPPMWLPTIWPLI